MKLFHSLTIRLFIFTKPHLNQIFVSGINLIKKCLPASDKLVRVKIDFVMTGKSGKKSILTTGKSILTFR